MKDETYNYLNTTFFKDGYYGTLSSRTTEELYAEELYKLVELYLSVADDSDDIMTPKKKSIDHKFNVTK